MRTWETPYCAEFVRCHSNEHFLMQAVLDDHSHGKFNRCNEPSLCQTSTRNGNALTHFVQPEVDVNDLSAPK